MIIWLCAYFNLPRFGLVPSWGWVDGAAAAYLCAEAAYLSPIESKANLAQFLWNFQLELSLAKSKIFSLPPSSPLCLNCKCFRVSIKDISNPCVRLLLYYVQRWRCFNIGVLDLVNMFYYKVLCSIICIRWIHVSWFIKSVVSFDLLKKIQKHQI